MPDAIVISVQDLTTKGTYTEVELERMVWALRYQLLYQFNRSPWVEHGYCQPISDVILVPRGDTPPAGTWHAELLDTSDQEGALGYHEDQAFKQNRAEGGPEKASGRSSRGFRADSPGLPLMKIFVKTALQDGVPPSEVLSHEALEAAVDPQVVNEADIRKYLDTATRQWYIGEVSDAVQGRGYDVGAPEGRPCNVPEATMADFCYPAWWAQPQTRPQTSFCEEVRLAPRVEPFELAPGGYMSVAPENNPTSWTQIYGQQKPAAAATSQAERRDPDGRHEPVGHRQLLELLIIIDRKVTNMEDVLAGLQADEAELATIVPKLVERDEAISKKLAEFEATAAAGEVVPRGEIETLKSGLDQSIASLKGLLPAPAEPPAEQPSEPAAPSQPTKAVYLHDGEGAIDGAWTLSGFQTPPVAAVPAVSANQETGAPETPEVPAKPSEPLYYFSGDTNPGETTGASAEWTPYVGAVEPAPAA